MPKVRTLQRQVSPTAAPTGAQGQLNPRLGDTAQLGKDVLGVIDAFRKGHEEAVDSAERAKLTMKANAYRERGRKIAIEGRNLKGLAASGFGKGAAEELDESAENQEWLDALEKASPKNRAQGLVDYHKTSGRFRTDYGGYEQSEVYSGKRQEYSLKISNLEDEFSKTPNKVSKSQVVPEIIETVVQDLKERGVPSNQAVKTAFQRVGDLYNQDFKRLIGEGEFEKAEDMYKTLKKNVNDSDRDYREGLEISGITLPYSGGFGRIVADRSMRGIDVFELQAQSEAQKEFNRINEMPISEGEKLKEGHKVKSNKVRGILLKRLRRQQADFKIADREERERIGENVRTRILEDVSKGEVRSVLQYLPPEELAKLSGADVLGVKRFSEELAEDNTYHRAYVARVTDTYVDDRAGLRDLFKDRKKAMQILNNAGFKGYRELQRFSKARDRASTTAKAKQRGARFPFREGERRNYVRDVVARTYPKWAKLDEKEQERKISEIQARVKNYEMVYSERNDGNLPSRKQVARFLYTEALDKGRPEAGWGTKIWNMIWGEETPEAVSPGTERPDPFLESIGAEQAPTPATPTTPAVVAPPRKTNWTKVKGAEDRMSQALFDRGLPRRTFRKMSNADKNKLLDALNSGDQDAVNEVLAEIKNRYVR